MNETSPNLLLISFCKGDNKSISALYKMWLPHLYLIAYQHLSSKEDAEDVVADCFEKLLSMPIALRKQKFIQDEINLKAFLIVMVKNRCLDKLKIQQNRLRIVDNIKSLFQKNSVNKVLDVFADQSMQQMLSCLPAKEQQILKMKIEGYNRDEISEELAIAPKTVSNSLSLSRSKMERMWKFFM